MACENPFRILNPAYKNTNDKIFWLEYYRETYGYIGLPDEYIEVPCGKCLSCKKDRLNGWRLRLNAECQRYSNSHFITLTFDDFFLRKFGKHPNKAVRLFLDRLRKRCGNGIRHFIIGEYGERKQRFHYHGILFNCPKINADELQKVWKYGFVFLGYVNENTANYVCKYLTKDDKNPNSLVKLPRIIASHGIGESFVEENKDSPMVRNLKPYLTLNNGGKLKLPRYIVDKLYDIEDKIVMKIINSEKPFERYLDGVKYTNELEYIIARKKKFDMNVSLGLSEKREEKKSVNTCIAPISFDKNNNPFDYKPLNYIEYQTAKSDFSINEEKVPF